MPSRYREIVSYFLKLGIIGFGGPAAHIALMRDELVDRRKWMTNQDFLDLMGATNLIPGPNSTEMTMHCGYVRGGNWGLILAGVSFILPACLITACFAYLYVEYGYIPGFKKVLIGMQVAVLIIIAEAVLKLGKKSIKNNALIVLAILVIILNLLGLHEVWCIFLGGIIYAAMSFFRLDSIFTLVSPVILPFSWIQLDEKSIQIFLLFLKIGSILFGSGYVLFAYLDGELVEHLGWLTRKEMVDAIAIGQFTPGPVLSTSTFIGYQVNGWSGAFWASLGIFLPSFLFVRFLFPVVEKMKNSPVLRAFLDGVNVSALAIMAVVLYHLGNSVLMYNSTMVWLILLIAILLRYFLRSYSALWILLVGALLGYLLL